MSRKVPGVRIPPAPVIRKEKSFGGDSKRGPADPGEEKGTEGGPVGANPPCSDEEGTRNPLVGIRNEVPTTCGRRKGPRAAPEGCPSKGYPPCSGEKIGEILWRGFETRSQPP